MKILLLIPKTAEKSASYFWMPAAIAYLSAVLKKNGHSTFFLDMEITENSTAKLQTILQQQTIDHVAFSLQTAGISTGTKLIENTIDIAKNIKTFSQKIKISAGGMYPTISPEKFIFKDSPIDYVVRGYGEEVFLKLLAETKPADITGVSYFNYQENKPIDNGICTKIDNPDAIPFPDYETINLNNYPPPPGCFINLPSYPAFIGRGCIFKCDFCTSEKYNKTPHLRSIENIIEEMIYVKEKTDFKEIHFMDATFTADKKHTETLCDTIISKNINITWHTATRAECLDKNLLDKMWEANCRGLGFGIESANDDLLKKVNRTTDIKQTKEIINYAAKKGFFIRTSYMFGFPGETKAQMEETKKLALSLPSDLSYFNVLNLQTMLKKETKTKLELKYLDLQNKNQNTDSLTPKIPYKEIVKLAIRAYLRFYINPKLILRYLCRSTNRHVLKTLFFKYIPQIIKNKLSKAFS